MKCSGFKGPLPEFAETSVGDGWKFLLASVAGFVCALVLIWGTYACLTN